MGGGSTGLRDISLHILDIMQNSTAAGATLIRVIIQADPLNGLLDITVEDNGCGMDRQFLARVTDPFSTTRNTRKVGLGIPLFKASAEQSGGSFGITSQKGTGTVVKSSYIIENIDRPPLGDIAGVMTDMAAAYPAVENNLSSMDINVISLYGTRDALVNSDSIEQSKKLLPKTTEFIPIEGGNHSQFGWYGLQSGDNEATIRREEQQKLVVSSICQMLESIK
jgi:hypothetical protein